MSDVLATPALTSLLHIFTTRSRDTLMDDSGKCQQSKYEQNKG